MHVVRICRSLKDYFGNIKGPYQEVTQQTFLASGVMVLLNLSK